MENSVNFDSFATNNIEHKVGFDNKNTIAETFKLVISWYVSKKRVSLKIANALIEFISDPPPAGAGGFLLYYLDIGIKFWNVRKCFSRIFLYTFYEDFSPISRYPDVMIFCFIDSMGTLATSYTLSYQILTRLDSHYITRQESGVLCGSINAAALAGLSFAIQSKIAVRSSTATGR
jgi:hypothetical protein